MKKLVIFDLDGTLIDTVYDIAAATNHALAKCGYPTHQPSVIKTFVGNGINKLFERALPEGHKDEKEVLRIREAFIPYYNEHGTDFTVPFDGMTELLYTLQRMGVKLAVASNKYQDGTLMLVKCYFPKINFSAILGQREGVPSKPDPGIVDEICAKVGVDKADTLYVGDSGVDMQTAKNASVEAVGVTWGCSLRTELRKFKPEWVVDTAEEVFTIVCK
jgi:phosphoglycolate phosphatase